MGKWQSKRYLLGNIALVVFLAFLVTLTLGNVSQANGQINLEVKDKTGTYKSNNINVETDDSNGQALTLDIKVYPITSPLYSSPWLQLKKVSDGSIVSGTVYNFTYSKVYGTNDTYNIVYTWTYNFVYEGIDGYQLLVGLGNTVYASVYLTVEVPPPEPNDQDEDNEEPTNPSNNNNTPTNPGGGGGGGGGALIATSGETTTTINPTAASSGALTAGGAVVVNLSKSGEVDATFTVDTAKNLEKLQDPKVSRLELVVPEEVKTVQGYKPFDESVIKVAAKLVSAALEAGKQVVLRVGDLNLVIPPDALDLSALAEQNANLTITVTRTASADAASLNDPAMKLASDVYSIEIRALVNGEDKGGVNNFKGNTTLTLKYDASKLGPGEHQYLGVYRQENGSWKYVGGKVYQSASQVVVNRTSLSTYGVLAYIKTFPDLAGHWADAAVKLLAARHVIAGDAKANFVPERKVTRAEFAAMILRTFMIEPTASGPSFKDVDENKWYASAVKTAAARGLVKGYEDGTFKPEQTITRQEMAALTVRGMALKGVSEADKAEVDKILGKFSDSKQIGKWARASVATAVKYNMVSGRTQTTCAPRATATRAEAAVIIKNMMQAAGDI